MQSTDWDFNNIRKLLVDRDKFRQTYSALRGHDFIVMAQDRYSTSGTALRSVLPEEQ